MFTLCVILAAGVLWVVIELAAICEAIEKLRK
jgi:hypothetical protein